MTPALVAAMVEVMGEAYPALVSDPDLVTDVLEREEDGFDRPCAPGSPS